MSLKGGAPDAGQVAYTSRPAKAETFRAGHLTRQQKLACMLSDHRPLPMPVLPFHSAVQSPLIKGV
jgi:hypothetical protein